MERIERTPTPWEQVANTCDKLDRFVSDSDYREALILEELDHTPDDFLVTKLELEVETEEDEDEEQQPIDLLNQTVVALGHFVDTVRQSCKNHDVATAQTARQTLEQQFSAIQKQSEHLELPENIGELHNFLSEYLELIDAALERTEDEPPLPLE